MNGKNLTFMLGTCSKNLPIHCSELRAFEDSFWRLEEALASKVELGWIQLV